MNCSACGMKTDVGDMIKCNGCREIYHYQCVNITSDAFREGKRSFKCESCANVTQRTRVTDDTPIRGARAAVGMMEPNRSLLENISQADCLSTDAIVDKVNSVIMARISAFETNILKEIKATVAVLALENSKLREELREAYVKCSSYEQKIKCLEADRFKTKEVNECYTDKNPQGQRPLLVSTTATTKGYVTLSASSHTGGITSTGCNAESGAQASAPSLAPALAPALPKPAVTSYASVASKVADTGVGDINDSDWIEVRRNNKRSNPIKRGGNKTISSLKAVERRKFLHVWRLNKSTTVENLKEYIKQVLGDGDEVTVEQLTPKTERNYASFKIGVTVTNFEKLCDPEVWPVNVEFSEWIWFRRGTKPNHLQKE